MRATIYWVVYYKSVYWFWGSGFAGAEVSWDVPLDEEQIHKIEKHILQRHHRNNDFVRKVTLINPIFLDFKEL